jgi:hypothetical protein
MAKPPPRVNRTRGVPVQFYLTQAERRALKAICKKRETSVAEVMRRWIWRATQEAGLARKKKHKASAAAAPAVDPRQLDIQEAISG